MSKENNAADVNKSSGTIQRKENKWQIESKFSSFLVL